MESGRESCEDGRKMALKHRLQQRDCAYVNDCLPPFLHEQFASELAISRQHAYVLRFVTAVL